MENYHSLSLVSTNPKTLELDAFFRKLFVLLQSRNSTNEVTLRTDEDIHQWLENVAAKNFHPDLTFKHALGFYNLHKDTLIDSERSIATRLLRSVYKTIRVVGPTTIKKMLGWAGGGGLLYYMNFVEKEERKTEKQTENKYKEKDLKLAVETTNSNMKLQQDITYIAEDLTKNQQELLIKKQQDIEARKKSINEIDELIKQLKIEGQEINKFEIAKKESLRRHEVDKLALLDPTIGAAYVSAATAKIFEITSQQKMNNLAFEKGIASHSLEHLQEQMNSTIVNTSSSTPFLSTTLMLVLGGFVTTSLLSAACVCSARSREAQKKTINERLTEHVTQVHMDLQLSDLRRIGEQKKQESDKIMLTRFLEFNELMTNITKQNEKLQMNHLMIECRSYKESYWAQDFLPFYYYLRNFVMSTYGWTDEECDDRYAFFFNGVFSQLDAARGKVKFLETKGQYIGEFAASIPVLQLEESTEEEEEEGKEEEEKKELYKPLSYSSPEQREERSNRYSYTQNEKTRKITQAEKRSNQGRDDEPRRGKKQKTQHEEMVVKHDIFFEVPQSRILTEFKDKFEIQKENGREMEFWVDQIDHGITKFIWGRKVWGKQKWQYLNNTTIYNENNTSCNDDMILKIISFMNEMDVHLIKYICRGYLTKISEALLPENKQTIKTDKSSFYYQCFIPEKFLPLAKNCIKSLLLANITFQNDLTGYYAKFSEIVQNFIKDVAPTVHSLMDQVEIVFTLRALTPSVIELKIVDEILTLIYPDVNSLFIEFGQRLLSLFENGKLVSADPSSSTPIVGNTPINVVFNMFPETTPTSPQLQPSIVPQESSGLPQLQPSIAQPTQGIRKRREYNTKESLERSGKGRLQRFVQEP